MRSSSLIGLTLGAAALAVLAGCGSGGGEYVPQQVKDVPKASVQPGEETNLFPMEEGNQWTYSTERTVQVTNSPATSRTSTVTFKVIKVENAADGKIGTVEISEDDKVTERQKWIATKDGLYQTSTSILEADGSMRDLAFNPRQLMVKFPVEKGSKFHWEGTGLTMLGESGKLSADSEIQEALTVDTDSGKRFSAIPVVTKGTFRGPKVTGDYAVTSWYSPGVGLVRFQQEVRGQENTNKAQIAGVLKLRLKAYVVK